jgi:Tfp pilus assembly protein PilF
MEELKKGSVEADLKARQHFEKALKIQPDYALACTGMSLSISMNGPVSFGIVGK